MRALLFVILCAALPCAGVSAGEETTRVEGAHFAVVAHLETAGLAEDALEQIEKLWKPASTLYGLAQGTEPKKLVVHLYRDAQDYEVAEEKLTGGRFRRNLAFAHFDTRSAHVALQRPRLKRPRALDRHPRHHVRDAVPGARTRDERLHHGAGAQRVPDVVVLRARRVRVAPADQHDSITKPAETPLQLLRP